MDSIGQLAGGVAHDFNNLLTIINGYSDMLVERLPRTDPDHDVAAQILKAGERAAGLTRQLLMFSRQQILEPQVLDLNTIVGHTKTMLHRLIGEDLHLTMTLASGELCIRADPGQIEQALLNLCVNARDAMPTGGRLAIQTARVTINEAAARAMTDVAPGEYAALSVSDTGQGMDEKTKARIFEPFFTTKGPGKGTGLGLAVVFGVVRQSSGHIHVESSAGAGATFTLYFPLVEEAVTRPAPASKATMPRGTETVLVVEDDAAVRAMTRNILQRCGYTVLDAGDGREAMQLLEGHDGHIDLLVSDVVMPNLGGRQLAETVIKSRPGIKVLFLSGHTDDAVVRHGIQGAEFAFLQKPFTPSALAMKVRETLDHS
jgi:two-component system cell cycle sensor histidine kinase/response regulator CckA